jgi:hypothetical protein
MKKTWKNGVSKLILSLFVMAGLFLFASSAHAQSGGLKATAGATLKPTNNQQISFNNLVDPATAFDIAVDEMDFYRNNQGANPKQEVYNLAAFKYYEFVANELRGGSTLDLEDLLALAVYKVEEVSNRQPRALQVNYADFLQTVADKMRN